MCKVKVLQGKYFQELADHMMLYQMIELENGFAFACCMTPNSDLEIITVEDYEKMKMNINNETAKLAGSK